MVTTDPDACAAPPDAGAQGLSRQARAERLAEDVTRKRTAELAVLRDQLPGLLARPASALTALLEQETASAGGALITALAELRSTTPDGRPGEGFESSVDTVTRHLTTSVALAIALTAQSDADPRIESTADTS